MLLPFTPMKEVNKKRQSLAIKTKIDLLFALNTWQENLVQRSITACLYSRNTMLVATIGV